MPVMTAVVALMVAHCSSRLLCIGLIVVLPYGGEIEHAKAKPMAQQMSGREWLASSLWVIGVLALLLLLLPEAMRQITMVQWLLVAAFALMGVYYMYRLLKRRLAGYTGDGLGATQQLTEIAIYAGLAVNFSGLA